MNPRRLESETMVSRSATAGATSCSSTAVGESVTSGSGGAAGRGRDGRVGLGPSMLAESWRVTRLACPRVTSSMSLVERPPTHVSPVASLGLLTRLLLGIDSPFIRQLVAGVVLIALMVLVLPLAIVVFIATSLLYYGVLMLLGIPSGTLGAALGFTWFGGSLALIGWFCVLAWRRLALIRVLTGLASPSAGEAPDPIDTASVGDPNADSDTVLTRVTAADTRLEGSPEDPGGDEPTSSGR